MADEYRINPLEKTIDKLKKENEDIKKYWSAWNGRAANNAALLEGRIDQLKKDVSGLEQENTSRLKHSNRRIQNLIQENEQREKYVDQMDKHSDRRIQDLIQKSEQRENHVDQLETEVSGLKKEKDVWEEKVLELARDNAELVQVTELFEGRISHLNVQVSRLKKENENKERQEKILHETINELTKDLIETPSTFKLEVAKRELKKANRRIQEQESMIAVMSQDLKYSMKSQSVCPLNYLNRDKS